MAAAKQSKVGGEVTQDELERRIKAGESVKGCTLMNYSPLFYAAIMDPPMFDSILQSCECDFDDVLTDKNLDLSIDQIRAIVAKGADLSTRKKEKERTTQITVNCCSNTLNCRTSTTGMWEWGRTILHQNAAMGRFDKCKVLLELGAKLDWVDDCGNTPYAVAMMMKKTKGAEALKTDKDPGWNAAQWAEKKVKDEDDLKKRIQDMLNAKKSEIRKELESSRDASVKTRVVIVPGAGADYAFAQNWYISVARGLAKRLKCEIGFPWADGRSDTPTEEEIEQGFSIRSPHGMPDSGDPKPSSWVPYILNTLKVDVNTILIGHSSGADAVLRILETTAVAGAVLVAGGPTDDDEKETTASEEDSFFNREPLWENIKKNSPFFIHFHCSNDEVVPIAGGYKIRDALSTTFVELKGDKNSDSKFGSANHFTGGVFPDLVDAVCKKLEAPATT